MSPAPRTGLQQPQPQGPQPSHEQLLVRRRHERSLLKLRLGSDEDFEVFMTTQEAAQRQDRADKQAQLVALDREIAVHEAKVAKAA